MSTRSLALSAAEPVSEDDYQAFLAVLSASERGRAFLAEHARRQREADTTALLAAIERLEAQIAGEPLREAWLNELNALMDSVRSLRSQLDAVQLAAAVAQLAAMLENAQQRSFGPAMPPQSVPLAQERSPEAEPKPVGAPFALALSAVAAQAIAAATDEDEPVKVLKAGTIPPPPPFAGEDFGADEPPHDQDHATLSSGEQNVPRSGPGSDALRQLNALSEEERLALFS